MNKNLFLTILLAPAMMLASYAQSGKANKALLVKADETLQFAAKQYKLMMTHVPDSVLPRTTNTKDGSLMTSGSGWWTSGFYPGTTWYLYEYTKDPAFKAEALKRMAIVQKEQYNTRTHDLGFMMYCPFGNALRITGDTAWKTILLTSARSLVTRFNPTVGCIKSWDHGTWKFPVIIDNMMNLELLNWATRVSGDPQFEKIARIHANTTIKNHFRADYSSYHVIDYDPATGAVYQKKTHQGAADSSAWARGQAWGLYGYTLMFRDTKDKAYLEQARHIADYILNSPRMPADLVPYWDYHAKEVPNALRDVSAAAVTASALLELSRYTDKTTGKRYWQAAEKMLTSLCSPAYLAKAGENNDFILMHSVGSLPHNSEVDVPLTYADYYFVEALLRYKQWAK
ncbi:glycoside hydrolase family 88 protein [Chitinophaga nivalis]|uniref:Glycoside hydrolase family 88 protein n=1 Tax=Chitinophaga nivalis TaxID=2991709 RepID=A0ABT3ISC6_9BACT|nr:glycoside hydrolase family 88 protein [Chitinophaga nivalis]MCW3463423.1 glycoside hydrolase family 88 protein [Chitinophaga nivalis]MCW3486887.1 glycoside hydrolase family 88 protein [Chitinophaga nivalis]